MKLIFVFLDGVGLASKSDKNPFSLTPQKRIKKSLTKECLLEEATLREPKKVFLPISASLDVSGAGQSGTGQFSIYTSQNGAKLFGKHFGPYLPTPLRALLTESNIFKMLKAIGKKICYANAYPESFIQRCLSLRTVGKIRSSVLFEIAVLEKVELRSLPHLQKNKAVSGDITNEWWQKNISHDALNVIPPEAAAENLLALTEEYDAVFYEFFLTDLVGHQRISIEPARIVGCLDRFLGKIFEYLQDNTLFVMTSDHGNFEDLSTTQHTQNPVPLLVLGKGAEFFYTIKSIDEVAKTILNALHAFENEE